MALQAGNRTYYNPTHGIDWRGSRVPYNTFYALMCLFLFFFMAFIFKLCYTGYRAEIKKAAKKQEDHNKKMAEWAKMSKKRNNGYPAGILKNSGENLDSSSAKSIEKNEEKISDNCASEPRVQFVGEVLKESARFSKTSSTQDILDKENQENKNLYNINEGYDNDVIYLNNEQISYHL